MTQPAPTWADELLSARGPIQSNGTPMPTRASLNFLQGTLIDNAGNNSTDVPAPSGGAASGYGLYSARPAAGNKGARYVCSEGSVEYVDDGTVWRPLILGCAGTEVAPGNSLSALTQVGPAPASVDVTGGVLSFHYAVNGGNTLGGYERAKTAGQAITVHIVPQLFPTGSNNDLELAPVGIWVRDTVSGKAEAILFGDTGLKNGLPTLNVYTYSSLTTYAGNPAGGSVMTLAHGIWLRILDTGTLLVFQFSYNGRLWETLYTDNATYLGNQGTAYGVGADPVAQAVTTIVDSFGVA